VQVTKSKINLRTKNRKPETKGLASRDKNNSKVADAVAGRERFMSLSFS